MAKSQLTSPRSIRFDEELELAILEAVRTVPDTSESVKSRQFSKAVRRLCRQALSGTQIQSLESLLEQLETLRREIAPIGSNLNQIAAGFNADGHLYEGLSLRSF